MKLTDLELKLLMQVASTFDILYAKMFTENIGTDERREQIRNEARRLREE